MSHSNSPDSGAGNSPSKDEHVISLCQHRRRRTIEDASKRLIGHLEALHREAIAVHNRIIDRAELSVLTELCRTTGLVLDRIDEELQASVVTPAALYGDYGGDVFGKKPLQRRIAWSVDDEETEDLLRQLQTARSAVWELLPGDDEPGQWIEPLAGPGYGERHPVDGIICREGRCSDTPGVYSGWEVSFDGHRFIVFGHRLDRRREVAVRDLLAARDDRRAPEIWRRIQLSLIRTIVDPVGHHQRPGRAHHHRAIRCPASRRGLVLAIRRALWRRFAEPREGLTIHAHIAALVDDPPAYAAFVDEVLDIADAVTIKFGGLPPDEMPIGVDELLRPFYACAAGHLSPPSNLTSHPLAVLLLEEPVVDALDLHPHRPIEDALQWADDHRSTTTARAVELASMTYRTEQNLVATYGFGLRRSPSPTADAPLPCASLSPVLPNLRTLFDPRFMDHTMADFELPAADRSRLERALRTEDTTLDEFRLADLDRDERQLTRLHGVSHHTCNAIREALLELGAHWRWQRCGLDPRLAARHKTSTEDQLRTGLDLLAEFFDN